MSSRSESGLSGPRIRAVLIGAGTYAAESDLTNVPAVEQTLTDLRQALIKRCRVASVEMILDPASPADIGLAVAEAAEQADDTLLVYYVGHGVVSRAGGLYLATAATNRESSRLAFTGLAYSALRDCLLHSPARSIVAVLDCCFSGRAVGVLSPSDDSAAAADLAQVHGGFVLTSAARDELALAPEGARHTAFTGELIRLLNHGDPDGPRVITLNYLFHHLDKVLLARGWPRPQRRASQWIDDLPLAVNPAYVPPQADIGDSPAQMTSPYPGLAVFDEHRARWFFGREQVTAELVARFAGRLEQASPLLVVGAAGAGKSSLLRAGLLSAVANGELPVSGSRTWPRVLITPTSDPVGVLATHIARLSGRDTKAVRAELKADPDQFAVTVHGALVAQSRDGDIRGARVLILVDQFEEVFTHGASEQDAQVFIRALCAAAGTDSGQGEPPALVALAVRADFFDRCVANPTLLPSVRDGHIVLDPMNADELRSVIEQPAQAVGLTLEPGLVDLLLQDMLVEPDHLAQLTPDGIAHVPSALPLLAHALRGTWERREDETLTMAGYRAAEGVHGAVAATAERTFQQLDDQAQRVAKRLLLRLVRLNDQRQATRLRVDQSILLVQSRDPAIAATVLDALTRARLITVEQDSVEIVHDALLYAWSRLREWIDTDRSSLHTHQRLTDAAQAWDRSGRPRTALYRNASLVEAMQWASTPDHQDSLGLVERDFLTQSEKQVTRTRRRRRLTITVSSAFITVIMAVAVVVAPRFLAAPQQIAAPVVVLAGNTGSVSSVAINPNGHLLASGNSDGTIRLWNITNPAQPTTSGSPLTGHVGTVTSVAFNPERNILVSGGADKTVRLWDVTDPAHTRLLGKPLTGPTDVVTSVAVSSDGLAIVAGSRDGTASVWDITDSSHATSPGTPINVSLKPDVIDAVSSVALGNDGSTLATNSAIVRLWDIRNRSHHSENLTTGTNVTSIAFSPSGKTLAAGSDDGKILLWSVSELARPTPLNTLSTGRSNRVSSLSFTADGRTLASGQNDAVTLWDTTDPTHPTFLAQPLTRSSGSVTSTAFTPDGHTLAVGSDDGTVLLLSIP